MSALRSAHPLSLRRPLLAGAALLASAATGLFAFRLMTEGAGRAEVTEAALSFALAAVVAGLWRTDRLRRAAAERQAAELERLANHDALTGLPSRRRLLADLEAVLAARRPALLLTFDLDGFKSYNDGFGHAGGDLLLRRLARALRRAATPHGAAYRLGGDEFCVLVEGDDGERAVATAACEAALEEKGTGFTVRASYGAAALPDEAADVDAALALADERLYLEKERRRARTAKNQACELALGILAEQDPSLHEHLGGVAAMAAAVGRRLGLDPRELDDLVRAAELHDVGKIAIPDSIVQKPAALSEGEWRFMHRHTLMGERMLKAVPALRGVAAIVRSSHERHDGGGYPDRLAGDEIPLASRIVFVCDAFDAMTTERPYRPAMDEATALCELRLNAGTQFDPGVVATFFEVRGSGEVAAEAHGERHDRDLRVHP